MKYDVSTHTYYVADRFSPALESKMRSVMTPEVLKAYDKFIFKNWGRRKPTGDFTEVDEVAEAVLRYEEEEKKLRLEQEALGNVTIDIEKGTESMGDLEMITETSADVSNKTHLEISTSEEGYISEEDLDDASIFFDFFDGEVDV